MADFFGNKRLDITLEPVTGKAIPLKAGEVLRIKQVEGGQCADFNCFNLNDYKEHMSISRTRRQGFRATKDHLVWSNRFRPMLSILEISEKNVTDMIAPGCNAFLFELMYGFDIHTNCQDTFSEAIREYGLTPDDVHDSFNLWMNTVDTEKQSKVLWNTAPKGDYVDFLAIMDVLAVPIVCGSGDVRMVSNFSLKPLQIEVFEASPKTLDMAQDLQKKYSCLKNQQRAVADFRVKVIRTERKLNPTPDYVPSYVNFPLEIKAFEVELTGDDLEDLEFLKKNFFPGTDEQAFRAAVMSWYNENKVEVTWPIYNTQKFRT